VLKALPSASLFVYGVATEGSVSGACRSLLALGRTVAVVTDATRGLDPSAHQAALEELRRLGVAHATTDEVLEMLDGEDW
jgi:nicotinamidase-related amidase